MTGNQPEFVYNSHPDEHLDHLGPWPRITNTAPQDERTANLESTESFNKCHLAEAFTCYLIDVDKRKTVETSVNLVVSK